MTKSFLKAGHLPTLFAAFLYFDLSFMVWVLLGPLGVAIAHDLHLDPAQKGLMVATPVLAGAFLRVVLGVLVDRYKPKRRRHRRRRSLVIAGLLAAWTIGAGHASARRCCWAACSASPAPRSRWRCRWRRRGIRRSTRARRSGIAGAGNSGTVLAALFAPGLALAFGWRT